MLVFLGADFPVSSSQFLIVSYNIGCCTEIKVSVKTVLDTCDVKLYQFMFNGIGCAN